jgi:RHS repeat-associated protein
MKRMKPIGWQLCALGLWLLSALCGECFWNPGLRDSSAAGPPESSYSAASTSGVYGPFGEAPRAIEQTTKPPFQFPTKCQDDETDQLYYGYRYYNPSTGRWLSRDPIEEESFFVRYTKDLPPQDKKSLAKASKKPSYLFINNNPILWIDILGLDGNCLSSVLPCRDDDDKSGGKQPDSSWFAELKGLSPEQQVQKLADWITKQFTSEGCAGTSSYQGCNGKCQNYIKGIAYWDNDNSVPGYHVVGLDLQSWNFYGRPGPDQPSQSGTSSGFLPYWQNPNFSYKKDLQFCCPRNCPSKK